MEQEARQLLTILRSAGHEAWWVGGCVRDLLLNRPLKDIDVATNARPQEVAALFPSARLVGASFGVVIVHLGNFAFEVATFRRDGTYSDQRRPDTISYGTLDDDARRRDFTINALYYDPFDEKVIDLVGGQDDLRHRLLRAVGDARLRFGEDALRLLRAIRFAATLGLTFEEDTWAALCESAASVETISAERVRDELTRMLTGERPARALELMDQAGLLVRLLPEIAAMKGVEQGPEFHPEGDVFIHTLLALEKLEPRTPVAAWATLLHDVGKPATYLREGGRITFHGHEKVGAEMAMEICRRLRFSAAMAARISAVVERHMRFMSAHEWRRSTMARFIAAETIEDDLAVHRADCLAAHGNLSAWDLVTGELQRAKSRPEVPMLPPPLVTGHDLIALGLTPGPGFRDLLDQVGEWQLNEEVTSREEALERLRRLAEGELRQGGQNLGLGESK